ncbi:MAG TPA: peptide deformylase [Desulfosporosinus sp.]|nr:peptide deformylase [Desulfosporosinus sp.]
MKTVVDKIITDQAILRQVSSPTTKKEVKDLKLIRRLRKATKTAWTKGCGLAAIQIGIPLRFAWFTVNGKEETLLNPEIIKSEGSSIFRNEGCLSIPHSYIDTERFYYIQYISGGKKRTARNFEAILIQHEIDHMDGILNLDRKYKK